MSFFLGAKKASTAFAPTSLSGLAWWLRGDLGTTVATGVSTWTDQSGAGDANRNGVQATGSKQPTLNAADANFNHQATLSFARASSQGLDTGTWSTLLAQPSTVFVIGSDDGTVTQSTYLWCPGGASYMFATNNGGTGICTYAGGGFPNVPGNTASPRAACQVFNGASSRLYVSAATAGSTTNPGTNGQSGLINIGSQNHAAYLQGTIAEIIAYNRALSNGEVGQVLAYAATRYAISIGP